MKTLALLSVFIALPLAAQTPDVKIIPSPSCADGNCPPVTDKNAVPLPRPLTTDEQVNILLDLIDAQQAWINQLNNLAARKGTFDDQTVANEATAKYQATVAAAKKAAGAIDTPQQAWSWNFRDKKWIAQPTQGAAK